MKAKWERLHEIIGDPNMTMAEKYGRLIAHIEKIEAELREIHNDWSKGNFDWTPDYLTIRKFIKEFLK